jgi:hypothetical protein
MPGIDSWTGERCELVGQCSYFATFLSPSCLFYSADTNNSNRCAEYINDESYLGTAPRVEGE